MIYGTIADVQTINVGENMTVSALSGATTIEVTFAPTFNENGGQLSINGTVYTYSAIDVDMNTITLTSGLVSDLEEDTRVEIYPASPVKTALVVFDSEDDSDAIPVTVPFAMKDVLADGMREPGFEEPVLIDERSSGEFYVADVMAAPAYTEAGELRGDGAPPIASPTPTVEGWVGALHAKWTAITSPDPVTYDVHISTTIDFVPDLTTRVGVTTATSFTIKSLPSDAPLVYGTTYYVKLVASDLDGEALPGSQGIAQMQPVTGPDISVNYVYAGEVNAAQINGGDISADLTLSGSIKTALTGGRTEIIDNQINVYDSSGQPGTTIAPDNSVFRGDAEIGGLTVKNALSVRGTANEVSTGGELQLASGITAPSTGPSVVQGWDTLNFTKAGDATFNAANITSVQWLSTLWICGYRDGSTYRVYRFNSDGTYNSLACDHVVSSTALQTTQIGVGGYCYTIANNNTIYRHRKLADTWTLQDDFTSSINGATWIDNTNAVWDSGTASAKLTGDSHMMTDNVFNMKSNTVQAKITRTAGTSGQDVFFTIRHGAGEEMAQIKLEGTTLTFRVGSSPWDGSWDFESSITYSATNHAYWKIWEEDTAGGGGNFHFATSATGAYGSWTEREVFDHDYSAVEMGVTEIRFTGQDSGLTFFVDEFRFGPSNDGISSDPYDTQNTGDVMTIGNDGTNILLAEHDNTGGDDRIRVRLITPPSWDVVSTFNSTSDSAYDGPLSGIAVGNFDFGAGRYVTRRATSGSDFRVFNSSTGARVTGEEFPPATAAPKSFTWDGSFFWELGPTGTLYKHTAATLSGSYFAAYTWYDSNATGGTHETTVSPGSALTLKRRAKITLTAAGIPGAGGVDDPNSVRFYVGTSMGALKLQSTTGAGVNTATYQAITTGGAAPPGSGNFVAGTAARLRNSAATLDIKGDGTIKGTNVQATGILTAANRIVGKVTITPSAAGIPTFLDITFPQALTGTTFFGVCSADTSLSGSTATGTTAPGDVYVRGVAIQNVTSTGCRLWVNRAGNTSGTGVWYMVEGV